MPRIIIDNWTRGLWTAGPPSKAPTGTLTRMQNMQVMDEGTVATRPGCVSHIALANTVDGAFVAGAHYCKTSALSVYREAVSLGFTQTGRRMRACGLTTFGLADDVTFFPVSMKKYYSGAVSNWGISVTPTAPSVVDAGVGLLTGNYTYKIAFYASSTRTMSALSVESAVFNGISRSCTVGALPVVCADTQATHIRIYRSQGTLAGNWLFLADVTLGTASYTDNTADAGLGDLVNNYITTPPTANVAGRYKSRILVFDLTATPRYGYASMPSYPEQFLNNLYEMVADAGDTVEEVVALGDYAFVFGRGSIYQFQVSNQGIIFTSKVLAGRGTLNGRTVRLGAQGIYFWSDDGIYMLQGFGATKVSELIDSLFRGTARGGLSTIADNTKVAASYVGSRYYFTYYGADGVWHTVIYNELKQRWKHCTGWLYTVEPESGSLPVVGLGNAVGLNANSATTDVGVAYTSVCGFNLQTPMTALMDIRTFRVGVQSTGTVIVSFYEDGILMYSVNLIAPTFEQSYVKHSLPLGLYFMLPEVVLTSDSVFTLEMFEADVHYARKY